eukprot:gene14787-14919_t
MGTLKEQFNQISKKYDSQRTRLIPCFHDFYTACLPVIGRFPQIKSVLDIGAGTGLFSQFIYQQNPDLHFTLMDISGEMLSVAKERFAGLPNFEYLESDFSNTVISKNYDLIISALAIHHLEDEQKVFLYANIYQALNPGGIFINADQVTGRTDWFDDYYKSNWRETIKISGLEQTAIDQAFERVKLDKFATLGAQFRMLETAGFAQTDCIYKSNNFVVFVGIKG